MKHLRMLVVSAALMLAACTPAAPGNTAASSASSDSSTIIVTNPTRNQKVKSPLLVFGRARGTWYFEGSFPVKLLDADGKVLSQGVAKAERDWMTEDFVPFTAQMPAFTPTAGTKGTLVLEKDNPSGLPQNAASIEIPVQF